MSPGFPSIRETFSRKMTWSSAKVSTDAFAINSSTEKLDDGRRSHHATMRISTMGFGSSPMMFIVDTTDCFIYWLIDWLIGFDLFCFHLAWFDWLFFLAVRILRFGNTHHFCKIQKIHTHQYVTWTPGLNQVCISASKLLEMCSTIEVLKTMDTCGIIWWLSLSFQVHLITLQVPAHVAQRVQHYAREWSAPTAAVKTPWWFFHWPQGKVSKLRFNGELLLMETSSGFQMYFLS